MGIEPDLVSTWIQRLRNQPIIAALCVLAIVLGGIAAFTDSLRKIAPSLFSEIKPGVSPAPAPAPTPAKRTHFSEDFSLGENGTFVSSRGITVRTGEMVFDPAPSAIVISSTGETNENPYARRVSIGDQIRLSRPDCDSDLLVTIKSIQLILPTQLTMEQIRAMGPGAELVISRKLTGTISGKCEE